VTRVPLALLAALLAGPLLVACARGPVEGPSLEPQRPRVGVTAADPEGAWRWFLDVAREPGPPPAGGRHLPAGLVVQSGEGVSLPAGESSVVLVEGDTTPVAVGEGVVRRGVLGSLADPQWGQGLVAVEWLVSARRRGRCAVEVCAVPRLLHPCGLVAVVEEARVLATIDLGEAILVGVDPKDPAADLGRTLVGAAAGRPGRLVFRVRD
jgi:hypothetical protein